jgi:hypothetical protein
VGGSRWYSVRYAPGGDPEYYWRNPGMAPWAAFLAGLVYLLTATGLAGLLERYCNSFGTLEYIVRAVVAL